MKTFYKTKLIVGLAAAMGLSVMHSANAADVDITASVEVSNAFDVTASQQLSFGQISAFTEAVLTADNGTGNTATLSIPANPASAIAVASTDDTAAKIINIADGAPATIDVTGAAPDTALTITTPDAATTPIDVTNVDPAITDKFAITGLTSYATLTGGSEFGTNATATTKNFTTDANGDLSFNLGATLSTVEQSDAATAGTLVAYGDGTYQATVTVSVDY
mgnify:CR=1 FL=1